ncbi:MAG: hypothetical protein K2X28_06425 [Alphaproteobacteria bacterium]|nr:hypothetical protein [Alphaproteobacteria bacterium]
MVKKFSYLVSVSVLASSLLSSASHAVYDEELRGVINAFQTSRSPVASSSAPISSPSSDESSWWSSVCALGSSVLSGTGHTLRYVGDCVRGNDSPVGDLLVSNGLSLAGTTTYNGMSAAPLIKSVTADPGALGSCRKTGGNALRYFGKLMAGETPTLERTIRQFWIDKRVAETEDVFTSTACALYRSELSGVDEIKLNYRKFIESWNGSSYAVPSLDTEKNVEYFLKGIIRGFVMNNQIMSEFSSISPQMAALGITYENLPVTKAITAETLITNSADREKLAPAALKEQVDRARQEAFMGFVTATYAIESVKKQADDARQISLHIPSALPAPSTPLPLMIEYHKDPDQGHGDSSNYESDK